MCLGVLLLVCPRHASFLPCPFRLQNNAHICIHPPHTHKHKHIHTKKGAGARPSWNWEEFAVAYPSLRQHLCIGGVYPRLLLEGGAAGADAVARLAAPAEFFTACYHRLLCCGDEAAPAEAGGLGGGMRQLCVKAMAAAYSAHAHRIGPFEGAAHALRLLDATPRRDLRHGLLLLVRALVAPAAAGPPAYEAADGAAAVPPAQRAAALRAAKANAYALMDAGGLELLVDVVAGAHDCSERRAGAGGGAGGAQPLGAGSLLTSESHAEPPKEWTYFAAAAATTDGDSAGAQEAGGGATTTTTAAAAAAAVDNAALVGTPATRAEIRALFRAGKITWDTPLQAPGMPAPRPLRDVRELRWSLADGPALLSPFEAAGVALAALRQVAALQPATDARGAPLQPPPRAHAALAGPDCLPHIAQAMLTGEPELVAGAAALLEAVLAGGGAHASGAGGAGGGGALGRLYLTGAFFFALAYAGSNLDEVARLLKAAHLRQAHRGPAELAVGLPLAARSYLGALLPESLLHVLEAYGARVFAQALAGDHDTPELIWTHAMRRGRLVPAVWQHLGDFPRRLAQVCGGGASVCVCFWGAFCVGQEPSCCVHCVRRSLLPPPCQTSTAPTQTHRHTNTHDPNTQTLKPTSTKNSTTARSTSTRRSRRSRGPSSPARSGCTATI